MKHNRLRKEWRNIAGLFLIALIPLGVLLGRFRLPPTWRIDIARQNQRKHSCSSNLHQLSLAMQGYLQDNNEKFPATTIGGSTVTGWPLSSLTRGIPPKTLPVGWVDALMPLLRSESLFMCLADANNVPNPTMAPSKTGYTDYWMNGNLSGESKSQILFPTSTIMLGEGNDGRDISDATYSKTALPPLWLHDSYSPAQRHVGGANYLMTDGAIHWLRPEEVPTFGKRTSTFALK